MIGDALAAPGQLRAGDGGGQAERRLRLKGAHDALHHGLVGVARLQAGEVGRGDVGNAGGDGLPLRRVERGGGGQATTLGTHTAATGTVEAWAAGGRLRHGFSADGAGVDAETHLAVSRVALRPVKFSQRLTATSTKVGEISMA